MNNQDFEKNQTLFSLLKREEFSTSKILSRESSVSQSSRIYYHNTTNEGVPFKWEMQPGTPKNPPQENVIPPPTPPPAVQSLAIPRPKVPDNGSKELFTWRFWSWKRLSKNLRLQTSERIRSGGRRNKRFNKHASTYSDGDSDAEFVGWVRRDHSRSSSVSSSSSFGSHTDRYGRGSPFLCSPWRT